ncbi:MAG: hypothetical protein HQ591_12880 [candidate division Zixibacteria bacterium]|nr:hypothetical protein [Candidatus Tariuqbacter arcticus]
MDYNKWFSTGRRFVIYNPPIVGSNGNSRLADLRTCYFQLEHIMDN